MTTADRTLAAAHRHAERARQALGRAEMMCDALERHGIPLTTPTTRWAADLRAARQRDAADAVRTVADLEATAARPATSGHAPTCPDTRSGPCNHCGRLAGAPLTPITLEDHA